TYAHEMGHGLAAVALGGQFESLTLFPDGSGLAAWRGSVGRVGRALVAGGGLMGPSVAGATLLAASRYPRSSRMLLTGIGAGMLLSALLVVQGGFGLAYVGITGAVLVGAGSRLGTRSATFLVQLLGVQLCVALFRDVHYMFSAGGTVGGQTHGSDSAAMAEALFLPYWFWGGLTAVFSALVLYFGLRRAVGPRG
ncbi:MAG: M50 family metallopeptidase, partial [Myxococcota bacterium]